MNAWSDRFRRGMNMLPEQVQARVLECIELDLPRVKGGRRACKGHKTLLHQPYRRCHGCKLEVLGNVAAELRLMDVVELTF